MVAPAVTFETISRDLRARRVTPVIAIHGPEAYYADALVPLVEALVPAEDRDFALTTLFAPQVEPQLVLDAARSLPMMVDRQVVIVKELQSVSAAWLDKLTPYLTAPNPATTLVIISRGEVFKSKSFVKALAAAGATVFESKPVKDWQIPKLLGEYIRDRGLRADDKALDMLHDFIGADLSKLYAEVDKLASILDAGAMVTPEAVERYVGVSREFNNYELVEALAAKDAERVFRIADAFASNPKANPLPVTAPTIFTYFSDLLIAYYSPDRSDRGVMQTLGLKSDFQLRRIRTGMSHYNPFQVIEAIHAIRVFDAQSKGQGSRTDPYLLFRDLLYHLLTAPGRLPV